MRIMNEVSYLGAHVDEINVLTLDDPELFKYPVAYIIEVGWWTLTDREAAALRAYIQKGGFVIVDDFKTRRLARHRRRRLGAVRGEHEARAARRAVRRHATRRIRSSTRSSKSTTLDNFPQAYNSGQPIFRGVFEDNDPNKRLLMIVNYNTDISQFWEWSGRGLRPFDETNEAYKLGVNYLIYGMTH